MADNKNGREKQAQDAEKRQRERDLETELARGDEMEPPIESAALDAVETEIETVSFPATGAEIVATVGDRVIEATTRSYTIAELVPDTGAETFESPAAVREQIQRPTITAAMKRITEAAAGFQSMDLSGSQRDAYEKTFRALAAIDADDDDEGIRAISEWIVERIRDKQKLPGSRDVRREAAKFCRANGYQVRDNEWLGI